MLRQNHTFTRSMLLALLLAVGSVQPHETIFCNMMDAVIHDGCCCADSYIDEMAFMDSEPCCEISVELGISANSDQVQVLIKAIKFESDVDPPATITSAVKLSLQFLDSASITGVIHNVVSYTTGSTTYLITQRLRI